MHQLPQAYSGSAHVRRGSANASSDDPCGYLYARVQPQRAQHVLDVRVHRPLGDDQLRA